ncbi:MAG: hypothetical protein IJS37_00675 [Bacilli bacterium]|nr:hypothetical protein [Bacilli bacterium]
MKTKAKLLLAISTLSAVVLAAGVTSTFAWFTTQNQATFTTGTLTVDTLSSIKVSVKDIGYDAEADFSAASANVTGSNKALGLVSSGNAQSFYAPAELSDDAADYTTMAAVTNSSAWTGANKYVGYIRYVVHVTADPETTSHDLKVYFTSTPSSANLASCLKIGFYPSTSAGALADGGSVTIYSDDGANFSPFTSTIATTSTATTNLNTIDTSAEALTLVSDFTNSSSVAEAYYVIALWVEGTEDNAVNALGGATETFKATFMLD